VEKTEDQPYAKRLAVPQVVLYARDNLSLGQVYVVFGQTRVVSSHFYGKCSIFEHAYTLLLAKTRFSMIF